MTVYPVASPTHVERREYRTVVESGGQRVPDRFVKNGVEGDLTVPSASTLNVPISEVPNAYLTLRRTNSLTTFRTH